MEAYLQQLVSYFAEVDHQEKRKGIYNRLTAVGQPFVPSDLCLVAKGLHELKMSGLIDCSRFFCDAGSADGRVVALAAACFSIPSLGIEYDNHLVSMGRENIGQLKALGIIRTVPASILQGNFCRDDTYSSVSFQDIATFYCFESNCYCLANKITEKSPQGTLFVYYTQNMKARFRGLHRLTTIPLQSSSNKSYYMHGFKKLLESVA
jgi:hypothetical protein